MLFNIEKLKTALAAMSIDPKKDHEAFESKEAYMEWLKDEVEYDIVQPLEREAAEEAGTDEYDCFKCENNEEARDIVNDFISNVESELF